MNPRTHAAKAASELKYLGHREAELVRRLVILGERHAFFPNEVSERQVTELARKLEELRGRIAAIEAASPAEQW
jgi:hypothetical protein